MVGHKVVGVASAGLRWVGREGGSLDFHPYLFLSKNGEEPFIFIQKSLHELNDFCVTLFESIKIKSADQPTFSESIESVDDTEEYFDVLANFQFGYSADDLGRMYCPASALVMLYANLIRSLHVIAKYYGEKEYKEFKVRSRDNRGPEITQLITLLEKICGEKLDVFVQPRIRILLDENMRTLRNDFLHGKWEHVEQRVLGINIKSCFEIVSLIMDSLEQIFTEDKFLPDRYETLA